MRVVFGVAVLRIGDRGPLGPEPRDGAGGEDPPVPVADVAKAFRGAERARLAAGGGGESLFRSAGDDVDHAADGVGAIERALRSAQNLDARHLGGQQVAKVELGGERGVVDLDPVDQNQGLVALRAANADLGESARGAGAADREPRHVAQRLGDDPHAAVLEHLVLDHGHRGTHFARGDRHPAGRDHHLGRRGDGALLGGAHGGHRRRQGERRRGADAAGFSC